MISRRWYKGKVSPRNVYVYEYVSSVRRNQQMISRRWYKGKVYPRNVFVCVLSSVEAGQMSADKHRKYEVVLQCDIVHDVSSREV